MVRSATVAALTLAMLATVSSAAMAANEIGVTSAVLPNARGTPPEMDTRILEVGNDMFQDERVQTVENGKVHLLFLDGSAMSIGPNSDLVLDEFVYDPDTKTGQLSFNATKGVFRFVGGKISKTTPVLIKTPVATIGIRGGVGLFRIGETIEATMIYGDELFVQRGNVLQVATRPGFQITVSEAGAVSDPQVVSSESLNSTLNDVEGTEGQDGTNPSLVSQNDVAGTQIANLSSNQAPRTVAPSDPSSTDSASSNLVGGDTLGDEAEATDSTENDLGQGNPDAGDGGGGGVTVGGLTGVYRHASDRTTGTDVGGSLDDLLNNGSISGGVATGTTVDGFSTIMFPVSTTVAADGNPGSGTFLSYTATTGTDSIFGAIAPGRSFVADTREFAYVFADETNFTNHGVFAFYGKPTPSSVIPTSGFSVYSLKRDDLLDADMPFVAGIDGGDFDIDATDVGRAFINWTPNGSGERAFAALTTFYNGLGASQRSMTTVVAGKVLDDTNGKPHIVGTYRGSIRSDTTATTRTIFYSAPVSSQDGADGSDFFGSTGPDFFVLGNTQATDGDMPTSDTGITRSQGGSVSTPYEGNTPATRLAGNGPSNDPDRVSGAVQLKLETAGISMEFLSVGGPIFQRVVPTENDSLSVNTLSASGTQGSIGVTQTIEGLDPDEFDEIDTATMQFGGTTDTSAFVSNDEFGAIESGTATVNSNNASGVGYFRTLDQRFNVLLSNVGLTPCTCEFLSVGLWGGQYNVGGTTYEFHQVPWVAGPPVTAADFPTSGTATYVGNAVGQVYNVGRLYTAFGTFNATVAFSPGTVTMTDVDIVVDNANMTNLTGTSSTGTQLYTSFSGGGTRGMDTLTTDGNARFTGNSGVLENIYGHYATTNSTGSYRQAGVFGAER